MYVLPMCVPFFFEDCCVCKQTRRRGSDKELSGVSANFTERNAIGQAQISCCSSISQQTDHNSFPRPHLDTQDNN
jgi:hypothetical protein